MKRISEQNILIDISDVATTQVLLACAKLNAKSRTTRGKSDEFLTLFAF